MIRRHFFLGQALILVVLACGVAGCESSAPPLAETPPPPVTVSQPVVREVVEQDDYEGRIAAAENVEVRARVRGYLTKVAFRDGQMVKQGELLYEIDPRPYQMTLDAAMAQEKAAQASLQLAKSEYERTRMLASKSAASREELDVWTGKQAVAAADILKAGAEVKRAQLDLDFTRVTAPISGKISRTQVDLGNLVNAAGGETLLTTLVSVEPTYVYFNVDERSLLRYRESRRKTVKDNSPSPPIKDLHIPVYVALEGESDYPHKGEIDFSDNRVNPSTGTIQVRGVLSNKERIFDEGMRARVRIPVSQPSKVVMVSERAVGTDQGRKFVYVVGADNVAQRRDITPGRLMDGLLIVGTGLKSDEWIVVNGIQRVRDGMKVEPRRLSTSEAGQPDTSTNSKQ
jgi:multidrug efflux system membrane fusion protein